MHALTTCTLSLLAVGATAFPAGFQLPEGLALPERRQLKGTGGRFGTSNTFDAERQLVSVTGDNKFIPPNFANGDKRGPCPGLNALANHGYLPRNGIATPLQFADATNEVFGLGYDVGLAVGVYGAYSSGDGLTWSIGGPPSGGLSSLPLLGKPTGISFSHNIYEGDASATREDFYMNGRAYALDMEAFKSLYNKLPTSDFATLEDHRDSRVKHSIATNPYYFNAPFAGFAIAGGANSFVFRLAANHTAEHPQGELTKETFASIWAVQGEGDSMAWKAGYDRLPENWYRRPFDDEYDIAFLASDLVRYVAAHPETAKIGGNTGKVNTFTGVDVSNLTGGVYNLQTLTEGNNLGCLLFQAGAFFAPDFLSPVLGNSATSPLNQINSMFSSLLGPLGCPQLASMDKAAFEQFPGFTNPGQHQ